MVEKNKTVLFVSQSLFGGGAERAATYFCSLLAEGDWDVHLLILQNQQKEYDLPKSVTLHRPGASIKGKVDKICYIRRVVKEVLPVRVVAFLYEPMICSFFATRGLPCEFWTAVRNNPNCYPNCQVRRAISKHLFRVSDLCLLQTKGQAPLIGFRKKSEYAIIPNVVGARFLEIEHRYSDTPKRFIAVGRLEDQKNYLFLLESFALAMDADPNCSLEIYGRGSLKPSLQSWIDVHRMGDRVTLREPVQNIERVLSDSDIYVLTSRYEGMPNSLMEAMAVGLPCISVDCKTGPSDLILDGINGYLVPEDAEPDRMASCMLKCMQDPQRTRLMGERARQTIKNAYSEMVVRGRIFNVFEKKGGEW